MISKFNIPSFIRSALIGSRPLQLTFNDIVDTNILSTSSFIYDSMGSPLKSTQQLNVDWSAYENHTFFMSAVAKTNIAFDQIINAYPFDGNRLDVERFFENLSGFDNWVFQQFPKFRGQLNFSGSFIAVNDHAGSLVPELSKNLTGESILSLDGGKSMTIEVQINLPPAANSREIILQKLGSSTQGFSMYVEPSLSTSTAEVRLSVVSGSSHATAAMPITKGTFNHVVAIFDRDSTSHVVKMFSDGEVIDTSRNSVVIGDMNIDTAQLLIGSGTAIKLGTSTLTPTTTLSGSLDELRIYHNVRTNTQLNEFSQKSTYSNDDLKLYYRFNEPPSPLVNDTTSAMNAIVIDSSGNSLHSLITNFTSSLRQDASLDSTSRMIYEREETAPVLFASNVDIISLNDTLLFSASLFDDANPNLITKLVPRHYLQDGQATEGLTTFDGNIGDAFVGDLPRTSKTGSSQLILTFLYIYARFFDELKLFIDAFGNLNNVDYDSIDNVPDNFLVNLVNKLGFNIPPLFNDASIDQFIRAENIDPSISNDTYSLRTIQNELLRRTLIHVPEVIRSKGTQHGIKSFIRSIGIDPDSSLRFREYGGPTINQLSFTREHKSEPNVMLEFNTGSFVFTPYLSSSRTEVGFPQPVGTFVQKETYNPHGISNSQSDGLLTSGSWTIENIVKWSPVNKDAMTSVTQSLCRLAVTGSNDSRGGLVTNFLAISSSIDPKLVLYLRSGVSSSSPLLTLELPLDVPDNIFNGDKWNVSFGCERNDSISSLVSSSYFIRAARQSNGDIENIALTSSFFNERANLTDVNVFRSLMVTSGSQFNTSGSFITIGENQSILTGIASGTTYRFLNDTTNVPDEARETSFTGLMSNLRFWSKALAVDEWREHVRNFKSRGVEDPFVNFNFVTSRTGSFERLRLETFTKQEDRVGAGSTGALTLLDFSQNGFHVTGSGFSTDDNALIGELFDYGFVSPNFDEATTDEKIRARSYQDQDLVDASPWAQLAPVNEIQPSERPTDDVRFAIEFSLVDALNRDIITMFSSMDAFDDALGKPELAFSRDYPDLELLRNIYFNRIQAKLNFGSFFEFFRWFDMSIGTFIEQLVPRKTVFKGINFTIESHVLERHKIGYGGSDAYLNEEDRNGITNSLFLGQIVGIAKKY